MALAVTAIYAGVLSLWIVYLAARVGKARRQHRVLLGDGGVEAVLHACRAHGNAVETIPLALLLMALAEANGAPALALHLVGLVLVAGRAIHGAYFFGGARVLMLRIAGIWMTVLVIVVLALGLLGHGVIQMIGGGQA